MQTFLTIGFYVALAGVLIVLAIGVVNLTRTDKAQVSRSNQLMRLRVALQFTAILFLIGLGVLAGAINFGG
ncbi:MAG: HIG1 domain-containing protein [Pseudomonadota bacterium]